MIGSPLIQEMRAQTRYEGILQVLEARFGVVPPEVSLALRAVMKEARLGELNRLVATCPDVPAFQARLGS